MQCVCIVRVPMYVAACCIRSALQCHSTLHTQDAMHTQLITHLHTYAVCVNVCGVCMLGVLCVVHSDCRRESTTPALLLHTFCLHSQLGVYTPSPSGTQYKVR